MGKTKKVFVSSTFKDLIDYRQAALDVIQRYKCQTLAMEHFGARADDSSTACDKEVKECDIFIGIYAHRYGFIAKGKSKSITHQEYDLAKKLGKPCLCFIVNKDQAWKPEFMEFEKYPQLQVFLDEVKENNTVDFFTTPNDFATRLATALGNELQNEKPDEDDGRKRGKLIPIAPTPFIAHPYPLQRNFTGRQAEKSLLSNWFFNGKEPMLVLEAIGGMGKSALSWVWLQEAILNSNTELDGVLWWSFYDAPFESFIPALYRYITSKEVKIDAGTYVFGDDLSRLYSIMFNNRFLFILDGFERALRGYGSMTAMFQQEEGLAKGEQETEWDKRQRDPLHPQARKFLQALCNGRSKTLMTTRLLPTPLEDLVGVQHVALTGLSPADAVRFLRAEGITGSRAELEQAATVYNFHPLLLKQLSTAIVRSRKHDIRDAHKLKLIDEKQPQKILVTSFNLLNKREKQVATTVAVLRSAFTLATARALFTDLDEDTLWQQLNELVHLGFLFYDAGTEQFDFHPIMRSFLYDNLTPKGAVHQRAVTYFEKLPKPEKVVTLEDLTPVIELYHHLVRAGKFDAAGFLYHDRLAESVYYQLSNYNLDIELLKELFPDGANRPARLESEAAQALALNSLANSYSSSGQPGQAVPLYLQYVGISEKRNDKSNVTVGLGNVAYMAQLQIGKLTVAAAHLCKSITLCLEKEDYYSEAIGHRELGQILAYQGKTNFYKDLNFRRIEGMIAEDELTIAFVLLEKGNAVSSLSLVSAYRSISASQSVRLVKTVGNSEKEGRNQSLAALQHLLQAQVFTGKTAETSNPYPVAFIQIYYLLGEVLLLCQNLNLSVQISPTEIRFYDKPFQQVIETISTEKGGILPAAERCLSEALRRCRKVNLVEFEADILLAHARLAQAKMAAGQSTGSLAEIEETVKEASEIAERAGYRLQLADIHLFCGEALLQNPHEKLLDLTAREHLRLAKDYAKDVSDFKDLYQSPDPHFYDGIPEYDMLKRGLTEQERIDNGYWVAYKIAAALEERL